MQQTNQYPAEKISSLIWHAAAMTDLIRLTGLLIHGVGNNNVSTPVLPSKIGVSNGILKTDNTPPSIPASSTDFDLSAYKHGPISREVGEVVEHV